MKKVLGLKNRFICFSTITLVTALASVQTNAAPVTAFEMTVVSDVAYGQHIEAGNSSIAIGRIDISNTRPSNVFFANNNLCVAYTKTGDFEKAGEICDAAVNIITSGSRVAVSEKSSHRNYHAMAYSNRGVLRALSGDFGAAREDFTTASELGARISAPEQNLEYLKVKESQSITVR